MFLSAEDLDDKETDMPNSVPKRKRARRTLRAYNNDDLMNAMCAVDEGKMSLRKAAMHFKIPRTTLSKKIRLGETIIKTPGPKSAAWLAALAKKVDSEDEDEEKTVTNLQAQGQDTSVPSIEINSEFAKPEMEVEDTIKTELEWCIACMCESDLSSTPEHVSTYKELLGKNVDDGVHPKFCSKCSTFLQDVENFKMTCLNSFSRLFESVFAEPLKYEETVLQVEDNVSEEVNDDHDFEVEVHEEKLTKIEINDEPKQMRKKKVVIPNKKVIAPRMLQQETEYCHICEIAVSSLMSHILSEHMTVLDAAFYNCNICDTKISVTFVRKHFTNHNYRFDEPKACETCGKQFLEVYRYKKHQETHSSFECDHCGKKINSKKRIKRHILTKHMSVKCCYHCSEYFDDVETYTAHMVWEKQTRPNVSQMCDICGFEAANKMSLRSHTLRQHTNEPVSCDKCGKTYKSRLTLLEHYKQKHQEHRHTCEQCGKKLSTKRRLTLHIENFHEPHKFIECDICGKSLRPKTLKNHKQAVHEKIYKCACKICGRAFKQRLALKKHYFSHVKKRPFNCHLCTDTGYYMTDYLKKHYQRIHGLNYTTQEVRGVMRKVVLDEEQMVADQIDEEVI